MKKQLLKAIGGASLAILMLTVFAQVWVSAQGRSGNERGLVGAWNVQVTIRDCQSGAEFFSFPAMITYNQGGTMKQSDLGDPSLIRLPGHGAWERLNGQRYSATFQFLTFNLDRSFAGRNVVRSAITLAPGGNAYHSTETGEMLNPSGVVINRGCATSTATRIE